MGLNDHFAVGLRAIKDDLPRRREFFGPAHFVRLLQAVEGVAVRGSNIRHGGHPFPSTIGSSSFTLWFLRASMPALPDHDASLLPLLSSSSRAIQILKYFGEPLNSPRKFSDP